MNALLRSSAIIALAGGAIAFINEAASAQTVIRVDIVNGSANPSGVGSGWGADAYKFLQDALDRADFLGPNPENPVEIWVAAGTYRPDQSKVNDDGPNDPPGACPPYGDCNRSASFHLRNNVAIYGGFPTNAEHYHGQNQPATFEDRDWVTYETILSGDLRAANVSATAVLDGFIVRGGIDIGGAQPRFRDCVIALHEGAAVRCVGGSEVMFHRCTFTGVTCGAIVVDEGSRLALVACEPGDALRDVRRSGIARVSACSELIAVDAAR